MDKQIKGMVDILNDTIDTLSDLRMIQRKQTRTEEDWLYKFKEEHPHAADTLEFNQHRLEYYKAEKRERIARRAIEEIGNAIEILQNY